MRHCEFCATELPDDATFCWHCGRAPTHSTEALTSAGSSPVIDSHIEDVAVAANIPAPSLSIRTAEAGKYEDENTIAGISIPQIPRMPNVPKWQIPRLPTHPNIPAIQQAAPAQDSTPLAQTSHPLEPTQPLSGSPRPGPRSGSSIPALLVAVIAILLIVTSIIGAGFTVLKPVLSLSGSTDVVWGGSIHLHGSNFIPASSVALTLDNTEPLYYTSQSPAIRLSHSTITTAGMAMIEEQFGQSSSLTNNVVVAANGTFNIIVTASPKWHAGQHTIWALEQISRRSAELSFTILQPGETPIATPTPSPTTTSTLSPTATPILSPTDTPSPTPLAPGLSCVKPAAVTLTVDAGNKQPVSQVVTLCATGSGSLNWKASWDHNAAPWLQLDHNTGQIQAPGQEQVTVIMLATGLKPGNYTTTVTFGSRADSSTAALTATFMVQSGCISVTPGAFKLSSTISNNSAQTQTVTVSNCGSAVGNWSASTNANWLKIAPTSGILSGGATQQVKITGFQGQVGTYNGESVFTLGSSQFTVQITLAVQAPTLSVKPASLQANNDCNHQKHTSIWKCSVTVTNLGDVAVSLNWSASSSGIAGITFTPASGTLAASASTQVEVDVPYSNSCQASATLTFSGPANNANVSWSYTCD